MQSCLSKFFSTPNDSSRHLIQTIKIFLNKLNNCFVILNDIVFNFDTYANTPILLQERSRLVSELNDFNQLTIQYSFIFESKEDKDQLNFFFNSITGIINRLNEFNKQNDLNDLKHLLTYDLTQIQTISDYFVRKINETNTRKTVIDKSEATMRFKNEKKVGNSFIPQSLGKYRSLFYKLLDTSKNGLKKLLKSLETSSLTGVTDVCLNEIKITLIQLKNLTSRILDANDLKLNEKDSNILKNIQPIVQKLVVSLEQNLEREIIENSNIYLQYLANFEF